jgi:hypothetical protein
MATLKNKRTLTTEDRGDWLDTTTGLTGGSSTYTSAAVLAADTILGIVDLDTETAGKIPLERRPKMLAVPFTHHTGATKAYDYVRAVIGFDVMPTAPLTYAKIRNAGEIVWVAQRLTSASLTQGGTPIPLYPRHRYYAIVSSDMTVEPSGDVLLGLAFSNILEELVHS